MHDYRFYVGHLRFVANRTERETSELDLMMDALLSIADHIEQGQPILVIKDDTRLTGRALAGVAGFLQQHILPEAVAAGNAGAESQIRWVIDTSMAFMATLMVHAETDTATGPCELILPEPPVVAN